MALEFSKTVREVIALSREICIEMMYDAICEEMFILGMVHNLDRNGILLRSGAARALIKMDIDIENLSDYLKKKIGFKLEQVRVPPTGNIPLTKQAEKVLKMSHQMTIRFGEHGTIDTIHILASYLNEMDKTSRKEFTEINGFNMLQVSKNVIFDDQVDRYFDRYEVAEDSIEVQLDKSKERIKELTSIANTTKIAMKPLSLIFDMAEYTSEEVKEIIALIGDVYHQQSGDHLVIKGMSQLQVIQQLECV
jgi:hypothetical protein